MDDHAGSRDRRQGPKSRRKGRKENPNLARLKNEVILNSRSLDNLTCPSSEQKLNKQPRQAKHASPHRRSSVQSDVLHHPQNRGSRKNKNNNNNNNNNGRRGQRRLKRSASVVDRDAEVSPRRPVRRTSSEGPRPRNFKLQNASESGSPPGGKSPRPKRDVAASSAGSRSTVASADPEWNDAKNTQASSLTELFAVEVGLAPVMDPSVKESRRRRIVFAVVLIALALLTASILLVAITLFLSPTVDEVCKSSVQERHHFKVYPVLM